MLHMCTQTYSLSPSGPSPPRVALHTRATLLLAGWLAGCRAEAHHRAVVLEMVGDLPDAGKCVCVGSWA